MTSSGAAAITKRAATVIYGTAGKAVRTNALVKQAISAGFRAIDTAAQLRSYAENLTGDGIRDALKANGLKRSDIWIQTKFTPVHDQDVDTAPYNVTNSLQEQVNASLEQSLTNLSTGDGLYLDAVLLHSPYKEAADTLEAWQALSRHVSCRVGTLGISNVSMEQLDELIQSAETKPSIVQNAFTAETGYDMRLRAYCRDKGIAYQIYGVLTGNDHLLQSNTVQDLSKAVKATPEATLYALIVLGLNVSVLNGTTSLEHMRETLEAVDRLRAWREQHRNKWMNVLSSFKGYLSRGRIL